MKIPRYWTKGTARADIRLRNPRTGELMDPFACWGWSDTSLEDAESRGRQRADMIADMIRRGERPDHYHYGNSPVREEILDEWKREDGTAFAAVTLNSYGCQVLNTADVMFVDVDLPRVPMWEVLKHGLKRIFGNSGPSPRERFEAEAMSKVESMVQVDPHCGVRVYRTCAGLRYLFTDSHVDPLAPTTLRAMEVLGSDPLYVRLCKAQQCFRARLTPKPWRCGGHALRIRYPWQDEQAEKDARQWIRDYSKTSEIFATCSLIKQLGSDQMDDETARIVKFHDEVTKADLGLALA